MGTLQLFFCIFVSHLIIVKSVTKEQDVMFFKELPGFSENPLLFPLEANFDFTPYDTIFSSWHTQTPDFHMLAELPPSTVVPGVQVFCDESKLTLLVDKSSNGLVLTREEIQLGDSCYSNRELPNHFVFTYAIDQCGTTHVMQNGLKKFTNFLHLNLKPLPTWWETPSTVHISCVPKRSFDYPNFASSGPLETSKNFSIKAVNPSWTSNADSNVYKRGQVVNLQVSSKPRPDQQLFIQSCFLSASPDPQTRHKHMVIMNKGCTANTVAQFVASDGADEVNFVLNTTYLYAELYIHCSVLFSDQGVTSGSKSCNYNMIDSRWEELSGDVEVCKCCSSRCKGLSVKHLSADAKSIVSTGPLVFVDTNGETSHQVFEPEDTANIPLSYSMKLDPPSEATENMIVSATSTSRSKFSPTQDVVFVRQDPVARLTIWQSGQVQDAEHSQNTASWPENNFKLRLKSDDLPELQPLTTDQVPRLGQPPNKGPRALKHESMWDLNALALVEPIHQQLGGAVIVEESQRNKFGGFGKLSTDAQQQVDIPLSVEINVKDLNDFNLMRDELAQMQSDAPVMSHEGTNDVQPIVRSKIQFSKGVDGSEMLSYEEEVVREHKGKGVIRTCGMDGLKRKRSGQKGMYSSFLDLLRMGKQE